jgi:hypothetical protein
LPGRGYTFYLLSAGNIAKKKEKTNRVLICELKRSALIVNNAQRHVFAPKESVSQCTQRN